MELYPIYDENAEITSNIWYSISGIGESPFMRVGHTLVHIKSSLNDENDKGKLYIIGGANPSGSFNDVYVFDLNSLSWDKFESLANFEKGRYEHSCFVNNSFIYLFGGSNESEMFNDLIKFDLNENSVENISNLNGPSARTLHNGCMYKNQLVVFGGGLTGKSPVNDQNFYIYNSINNKWISIDFRKNSSFNLVPSNRHGHVMINLNDNFIYLHGGMNEDVIYDDLWILDMKTLKWKKINFDDESSSAYPCGRAAHGGISVNNNLYIFGGITQAGRALDDLWKYDSDRNQWTLIEIFGYKPPSRLDFAYCKASFKNKTKRSIQECENDIKSEEIFSEFLVIHGGMDTEGNIFDDLYLIKLD